MALAVAVGLAGAVGAVARYLLDGAIQDRTTGDFPFGTLTVNVVGSFVLGLVAGLVLKHSASREVHAVVGTGLCGGLTTWSTAAWESVRLAQDDSLAAGLRFTLVNLALSLVFAGIAIALTSL